MPVILDNPDGVHAPLGRYSHSAEAPAAARLVFVSGQVGMRPDGTVPHSAAEQADQAYANLVAVLAAKGVPPANIVKLTTFIVGEDEPGAIAAARAKHLGEHRPASTAVYVSRLVDPAWKVEIEAVAVKP